MEQNIDQAQIDATAMTPIVCPSVRDAGRLGGLTTLLRHGRQHFSAAGRHGQETLQSRYTSQDRRRWGALGGRPRKIQRPIGEKRE